ncbi:MAG: lamin tail domain-containing protein [Phycisphaerales bacterium]|nr:MAG: lamin tail domain-containing protein [Phycisphaerales bacterium]
MRNIGRYSRVVVVVTCMVVFGATKPSMGLKVSEVMYHPVEVGGIPSGDENLEFIELYNDRAVFEDLSGYAFTNGVNYVFGSGTILGAKQYLVVARDPAAVEAAYGISGVYGPFSGRLNNDGERIELSNNAGQIIISFRYNDGRPWPASPDGTGHSLIRAKLGGDPDEASTWSPSTYIGGSPGTADQAQVDPEDPTLVTLVDLGHPGRYFKGNEEPSPVGGKATTAWTQIGFNDNPGTTGWRDGASGYGYSSSSAERQWIRTELNDMQRGYISIYARLRFTLTAEQIASFTQLRAEVHYDDGFALYLNGTRVAPPTNLTGNPPAFNQGSDGGGDYDAQELDLTWLKNQLVVGTNVLAMQVHNASTTSSDCIACPILRAMVAAPGGGVDPTARVVINELLTNSDAEPGTDWLELYNPGPAAVDLSNVYLSDGRFDLLQYKIPDGTVLEPGEFWAAHQGTPPTGFPFGLGFAGETIFLTAATDDPLPQPIRVLDAVRFGVVESDVTLGRFPDGSENFGALSSATYAAPNTQPLIRDIVINEIMYHHGTREERYEYVELYNKGTGTVYLDGWAFTDGIGYDFEAGTRMPAGSYLVVAKDPNFLETVYDNLTKGSNLVGPYSGNLDDHSERIRLSYPIMEVNPDTGELEAYMATADEVTYYDGGRWPSWADGQGASLELRDPQSNNDTPDAWADSDESNTDTWQQFSYTISGGDSRYSHSSVNVFGVILLNRGEVLLDDIELIIDGSNRLNNSGFESGESNWRTLGNHVQSFVTSSDRHSGSRSLHLIATGHGDPGANRVNQSISSVTAGTVTFRGWARWLRGCPFLLLRTSRELSPVQPPRPAYAFDLGMPVNLGSPGRQNTTYTPNRGPEILDVRHDPALPGTGEPIVVTATAADNDGMGSVRLYYRSEGIGSFSSIPMVDNGSGNDLIAGDSIFTATIPGAPGGTMRAFYIEASDGSASTRFPTELGPTADVPNRTCLVRVGDVRPRTQFATYRIWMSNDVVNTFRSRPNLSNELMDCTFVYNNTDVFYNAKIRFRGSPWLRSGYGRDPRDRYAFRIDFPPDQKFGRREEINLDNTEGGNRGPLQERACYWFHRQLGLYSSNQEFVRPIINGNNHSAYEDVQKIDGDYISGWFPDDTDGYIHKIDDYFEYTADGREDRNLDEGLKYDSRHPLLKETYRWGFEKRSHRENDNWDHLFDLAVAMNSPSTGANYEKAIESVIHPEQFAQVLALRHAVGDWDSYGYTRGKNNYFYYALPEGKWYLLPWDIDFALGSGNGPNTNLFTVNAGLFPEVDKFLNHSKYRQMYLQSFALLVHGPWQTSYGTSDPPTAFDRFLDDAAAALIADGAGSGRRDGIKQFVRARRDYILSQIPALAFMITTNDGEDFCTSAPMVTLTGIAPLDVMAISVNDTRVSVRFAADSVFEIDVPLEVGANPLTVQGLNRRGQPVAFATDSIVVTRVPACEVTSVTPSGVCNNGTAQLTIHGANFEPRSKTLVALTRGSGQIGFDALYVQSNRGFDRVEAATLLLDDPERGVGEPTHAVHERINLWNAGDHGVFTTNEESFAPPFNTDGTDYAVRFTGYIYAPSPGLRYFGVNSDEGFSLWIGGHLVGQHAMSRTAATTDVTRNRTAGTMAFNFPEAGSYYMVLDYFENSAGEEIEFFQTDSSGGDRKLINVDAELVVFPDDSTTIEATSVAVPDENTITCQVDVDGAEPGAWNVVLTPPCGGELRLGLDAALLIGSCTSDFNHDSDIDFFDAAQLANMWDEPCSGPLWCGGIDIDRSGRVDIGDLAILAHEWLLSPK